MRSAEDLLVGCITGCGVVPLPVPRAAATRGPSHQTSADDALELVPSQPGPSNDT